MATLFVKEHLHLITKFSGKRGVLMPQVLDNTTGQYRLNNPVCSQTHTLNKPLKEEAPAYRLNSVQLIIGDEEKVFQFVTAPPPSKSGYQVNIVKMGFSFNSANSAMLHF